MQLKFLYYCDTTAGRFYIGQSADGRYHPFYNGETYGSYHAPWQASEDLANNGTFSILHATTGDFLDTSQLGIPLHTSDWERINSAN